MLKFINFILKNILIYIIVIISFISYSRSVEVSIPNIQSKEVTSKETSITNESGYWLTIFQVINKYIRFSLGVVGFGVLIYGGISLMTAEGDESKFKKANKLVQYAIMGLILAICSYFVIKMVVNLF